jgi:predicted neutral ceramidase superfamily lipid hydrolase
MPISVIFENIAAGASIDDLVESYDGLGREGVKAVIEIAALFSFQRPISRAVIDSQNMNRGIRDAINDDIGQC